MNSRIVSKRDRVRMSIAHQQPDKVPWNIGATPQAIAALSKYLGDARVADPAYFHDWAGSHFAGAGSGRRGPYPKGSGRLHGLEEEVSPGLWRDGWGVVWDTRGLYGEGEWGTPMNCVLPNPTLRGFRFPDPPGADEYEGYPQAIAAKREYFITGGGGHLFEAAWALRGLENFLADMIEHPEFVDELLEGITDYYLDVIDKATKYDIDAFSFGDDWGSQTRGLIMGPRLWRRFIKPNMARMFARIKEAGKFVHIHSDGDVSAVFEDLIEIGLDVYNPFQPEIMDVYEMKRKFGDRLTFHGGVGIQELLPHGTLQQIETEVRRLIDEIGDGGGFILSASHSILADTPPENLMAFIEVARQE